MNLYALTQCNMTDGLKCWCVMPDTNKNITQPKPVSQEEDLNCGMLEFDYLKQNILFRDN